MPKKSAGILLFRKLHFPEVFLVHPGGPFFKNKDIGVWTIPKGELEDGEDPFDCAIREFEEETGFSVSGSFEELEPVKQKSGKLVYAWAVEGDLKAEEIKCNTFVMEWPPRSGKQLQFPEIDKAAWFQLDEAMKKINEAQRSFLQQLSVVLSSNKKA